MNILLADDDKDIRQIIQEFLEKRGYQVTSVSDGLKALLYLDRDIDLLITDIQMPGISGIDLLRTMRERFPNLPVILITAHGSFETALEALRNRACDYLQKPLKLQELIQCIERIKNDQKT